MNCRNAWTGCVPEPDRYLNPTLKKGLSYPNTQPLNKTMLRPRRKHARRSLGFEAELGGLESMRLCHGVLGTV